MQRKNLAHSQDLISAGKITTSSLNSAVIEEFIVGPVVNLNFFYSPLCKRLELIGTDTRRQTNLDGLLRLPADQQMKVLAKVYPKFEEAGHIACTVLESMLEPIYNMGEKFVSTVAEEYPPGIIGPFALQCCIQAGPPQKELVVFDVSLRMPGSPGINATPYSEYYWGRKLSLGERIAQEVLQALRENRLDEIVS